MKAMTANLPSYASAINNIIGPTEQAKVDANKTILPQQNALQLSEMLKYLPQYTDLDVATGHKRALGTVNQDAEALRMAQHNGLIDNALALQRKADPEYYHNRETLSGKLDQLSQFDPNKLSGSEIAQTTRGLNQTSMGAPNLGGALAAAATFGNALAKRRGEGQSYVQTITQALPVMKSTFDPYQVATGKNSGPGQAAQSNRGYDSSMGQTAANFGQNVFGAAADFQKQNNDQTFKSPTGMDIASKGIGMASALI